MVSQTTTFIAVHVRDEEEADAAERGGVHVVALLRAARVDDAPAAPRGSPASLAPPPLAPASGTMRRQWPARVQERHGCERRRGHAGMEHGISFIAGQDHIQGDHSQW